MVWWVVDGVSQKCFSTTKLVILCRVDETARQLGSSTANVAYVKLRLCFETHSASMAGVAPEPSRLTAATSAAEVPPVVESTKKVPRRGPKKIEVVITFW